MSSDIKVTRAPPGTHKFTKRELTHINCDDYNLASGVRHHIGGLEIQNNSWNASIKVAVPSRLAQSLHRMILNLEHNGARGDTRLERVKWARKDILSKFDHDSVLLDMTSDDEETLNRTMRTEHHMDACYLLTRNTTALPKVYTDWSPSNTELALTGDGLRLVFKDSSKRALIKVVVGDFDESAFKPSSTKADAPSPQPTATPVTPMKRKTVDPRHEERVSAQSDPSANPFKQARVDHEMGIEAKRASSAQKASTSIVDTKIYDHRKLKPIPGGFLIGFNSGFGNSSMAMSFTKMAVPSDLAKRIRDKAMSAASGGDTKLGKTPAARAQAATREMMKDWTAANGDYALLNLASHDETRILGGSQKGYTYTSVLHAVREQPFMLDTMSMYNEWEPDATTVERQAGQVTVAFKDYSGRDIIVVSIKG